MSWLEQQQAFDRVLQSYGVKTPPLEERRREHVRELRRDRQAKQRACRRAERKRQRTEIQLWRVIERTRARWPAEPRTMKIHVLNVPRGRSRRRFLQLDRVWRITFDGRDIWAKQFRAKQLGDRERDKLGRFAKAKMQPVPVHRSGCAYELKSWHIRACLMSVVQKQGAASIAAACGHHRTSVWRCLHRGDILALAGALRRSESWRAPGATFRIEIPVRHNPKTSTSATLPRARGVGDLAHGG
jgi:hypothetical protein